MSSSSEVPVAAFANQMTKYDLETPNLGDLPTRVLRITVEDDGTLTQSGFPALDTARIPHDLCTFVNQAFSSNHLPPYFAPNLQRFPNVENFSKNFLAPGTIILVLVRDVAGGGVGPSDFIASFGLGTYDPSSEVPDPINNPHSTWSIYIDPNSPDQVALPAVLKCLAVNPSMQGHGLGRWMVEKLFEHEAIARARLAGQSKARLVMTTMLELNETFYKRLGWTTTRTYVHQLGYIGNTVPITAVQMEKIVEVK